MEPNEKKGRDLNEEEKKEMRLGQDLYAMTQMPGWTIMEQWLKDRAFHSWVDPRDTNSKEEWDWRELNAFHSADVSKQLIEEVSRAVARADYLGKVASGEIEDAKKFKI
jgi:hypothetical protein